MVSDSLGLGALAIEESVTAQFKRLSGNVQVRRFQYQWNFGRPLDTAAGRVGFAVITRGDVVGFTYFSRKQIENSAQGILPDIVLRRIAELVSSISRELET